MSCAENLLKEFLETLRVQDWHPEPDLVASAQAAIDGCGTERMLSGLERSENLFADVNRKLHLNRSRLQEFLDGAARERVFPNYHGKNELLECFNFADIARLHRWLRANGVDERLSELFTPISKEETLAGLHNQLATGKIVRSDAKNCDPSERKNEVLRSLFGGYVFNSFASKDLHRYFNEDCRKRYHPDFYAHLLDFHAELLRRSCALILLIVDEKLRAGRDATELRNVLYSFVQDSYERLANHCFFGVIIRPFEEGPESGHWTLFSDLILYAEKHREMPFQPRYFLPKDIEKETVSRIPNLVSAAARFDVVNEGFFFKDCIVMPRSTEQSDLASNRQPGLELLLLFEKNERDETRIPCPGCRSWKVAGNSYPVLGVKSWECENPICPDRSAFDRGNRYSLSALIKQQAINSEADQIPELSLRKWKLDIVREATDSAVIDMLVRHFTLHHDAVILVNAPNIGTEYLGRTIISEQFHSHSGGDYFKTFQDSAYFRRFVVDRHSSSTEPTDGLSLLDIGVPGAQVYQGDCFEILSLMRENSIGGAVTSPPYYNARSYAEWPNIYSYLYDMYNSARQVLRVLKPGSLYLFNIFDYFDNENNVVFSAMGKKRMILGAYIINLFRRVGFRLITNVVWDKGEIEGKRNFNQGNKSPYYQFPLNCWEHVLVFQKPSGAVAPRFPLILDVGPVIKMIRGENVLGHSAPFPNAVPDLLLNHMDPNETVLDPFSGSMTTGRRAFRLGMRSISIEIHREYCELGLRLLREENSQALLQFDSAAV